MNSQEQLLYKEYNDLSRDCSVISHKVLKHQNNPDKARIVSLLLVHYAIKQKKLNKVIDAMVQLDCAKRL